MWRKFFRYSKFFYIKVIRSRHSAHSIALAIALGIFVGCFFPLGCHTIVVILLAFIFRVDKLLSFIATWIMNPYTIPILYPFFCYIGAKLTGYNLTLTRINKNFLHCINNGNISWHNFEIMSEKFIIFIMLGGLIVGLLFAIIGYYTTYFMVKKYRRRSN